MIRIEKKFVDAVSVAERFPPTPGRLPMSLGGGSIVGIQQLPKDLVHDGFDGFIEIESRTSRPV